jgi:hypothetical protein
MIRRKHEPRRGGTALDARPLRAHRQQRRRDTALRCEVRERLDRIEGLRRFGATHLGALREVGLPRGTWETLAGGSKPVGIDVAWLKRGRDYRNERHNWSHRHITTGGTLTICGCEIPTPETHQVVYDDKAPRGVCAHCDQLATLKGVRRG